MYIINNYCNAKKKKCKIRRLVKLSKKEENIKKEKMPKEKKAKKEKVKKDKETSKFVQKIKKKWLNS